MDGLWVVLGLASLGIGIIWTRGCWPTVIVRLPSAATSRANR
jgi:hypothetical protein